MSWWLQRSRDFIRSVAGVPSKEFLRLPQLHKLCLQALSPLLIIILGPLVALKTEVCLGLGAELVSQQIFGLNLNHFESSLCSPGFGGVGCTEFWCGWAQCVWGEEAKCSPRNPALLSDPLRDNLTGEQDPKMSQRP